MVLIAGICFSRLEKFSHIRTVVYNASDPKIFEAAALPGFVQQSPDAPKLVHFRGHIAPLIVGTDDVTSQLVVIEHWVRGQESDKQFYLQPGQQPGPMVDNTEEPEQYLEQQRRGIPSACRRFSYILTGALLSVGINARVVAVEGSFNRFSRLSHNLVEVWIPQWNKWILVDPTIDAFVLVNGNPASLLEVYAAAQPGSQALISFDQHGSHYRLGPLDKYRQYFRHLYVARTNAIFDGYHYGLFEAKRIEFVHYTGPGIEPYPQRTKELLLVGFALSAGAATLLVVGCLVGLLLWPVKNLRAGRFAARRLWAGPLLRRSSQRKEIIMGFMKTTGYRLGIAGEVFSFFWGNKRWWMTPILTALFLFAVLLILAQSSAIAPFIYSFF